ncbi:unnamed protein product [Rotaria sp. Silwood2]|nr:unnamed protein product [Rotaria sp. Silwood2]CAF4298517.1 unnamed protein product [Rotaria sp. Silwood2]
MFTVGLTSGIFSILTFQSKSSRKAGCGLYLLAISITSILNIIFLNIKVWFLILSQMAIVSSESFLLFNCISLEFILQSLLAMTDWFHVCVSIERCAAVFLDVKFNLTTSKKFAKLVILIIISGTCISFLHDPIYRRPIDDEEDQRTWCLLQMPSNIETYNSFINIFHFIVPSSLKVIPPICIIVLIANKHVAVKQQDTYIQHLKKQ